MNAIEKKQITEKSKKRYFKLQNFARTLKTALFIFPLLIPIGFIIAIYIKGNQDVLKDLSTWKDIGIYVLLGIMSALIVSFLTWLGKINLFEKREELAKNVFSNKEKIEMLKAHLQDEKDPTKKDLKILSKMKKLEIKNEQIENEFKVLDM